MNTEYNLDIRSLELRELDHFVYDLSRETKEKILKLVKHYKLHFSALDLLATSDGEEVFLELNPNGQWLWLEIVTGVIMSETFCDLLLQKSNRYTLLLLYTNRVFFSMNMVNSIKEIACQYKYIIIGELHGIQENVLFLKEILNEYILNTKDHVTFAFEWPLTKEENKVLGSFVLGRIDSHNDQFNNAFSKLYDQQSGVFSDQHLSFIKEVRDINLKRSNNFINIIAFDPDLTDWNARDKQMAMSILEASKKIDTVIVVTGDLHARKHSFRLNTEVNMFFYPLASHLPSKETFSIKLKYKKGKFFNFGVKDIPPKIKKERIDSNEEVFHDSVYHFESASPVTLTPLSKTSQGFRE